MFDARRISFLVVLTLAALATPGCSDGGSNPPLETPDDPLVEGPITEPGSPFVAGTAGIALSEVGFEQAEFFISGTASAYANVGALSPDGAWEVEAADTGEFKTRALVYRPIDPEAFSGTVIVEWLNVSGGLDAAPDWISMHTEAFRQGHAWVGVSAQIDGIEGRGTGSIAPLYLKAVSPERYAPLMHPGDSFSYDMFSQVAQAIRNPVDVAPLQGLVPERIIAVGESQSAGRLITWINALGKRYGLFDGYIVHSRLGGSARLSQAPQPEIDTPEVVNIRTDLRQPTLMFQTESDLLLLNSLPSNQPDSSNFRLWEVAGTAHADVYTLLTGQTDLGDDPSVAEVVETTDGAPLGFIQCERPINSGPAHWVLKAGLRGLIAWMTGGQALPEAPRLQVTEDGTAFELDALGNALGGIRTNYVDVPVAKLSGLGQSGDSFCRIFGTTELFDAATLGELYPTEQDYVDAVTASAEAALAGGFLLRPDADLIIADATESGIGGE
jgi:hypothetical protein